MNVFKQWGCFSSLDMTQTFCARDDLSLSHKATSEEQVLALAVHWIAPGIMYFQNMCQRVLSLSEN